LDRLVSYRAYCLSETRKALLQGPTVRRDHSPVGAAALEPVGEVEGLAYVRCPETGSLFLAQLPAEPGRWATLLAQVSRYRHSPAAFHVELAQSRADNVYAPKLEWIRDTLRLQGLERPRLLEVTTPPSDFTPLLKESGVFSTVLVADETVSMRTPRDGEEAAEAAVLLESLDRVDDPAALLKAVAERVTAEGLVFVTALVASGFDVTVLGLRNLYLYPPDRTNCFTVQGLSRLLEQSGFTLVEVSTPGVLDVAIVKAHLQQDPLLLDLPPFERQLIAADEDTQEAFQAFLQQQGLSSFARVVARRSS
jgi:hypothetical protein